MSDTAIDIWHLKALDTIVCDIGHKVDIVNVELSLLFAVGIYFSEEGDFLLINRNGLWDLPKGHQEAGEDIRTTAMREVQEETGVMQLELRDLICITDHCYRREGVWHLKHTWWYDMLYTDPVDLTPQREEDISKAAWVARSSLPPFLKNTYPSIVEVFRDARI